MSDREGQGRATAAKGAFPTSAWRRFADVAEHAFYCFGLAGWIVTNDSPPLLRAIAVGGLLYFITRRARP